MTELADNPTEIQGIQSHFEDRSFRHLAVVIAIGILTTTLPRVENLSKLPLRTILSAEMDPTKAQMSLFFVVASFAWYFKPLAGLLTDAFPIFGTRRRHYLLICSSLASLSWLALGFYPHEYNSLLIGCVLINLLMVMMSTVVGAILVEAGKNLGATGRLSAVRQTVASTCGTLQGAAGGWLALRPFFWVASINAALVFFLIPTTRKFITEKPQESGGRSDLINAGIQLKAILASRTMWIVLLILWLFYFAPGLETVMYDHQTNDLHFSAQFVGYLDTIASVGSILAAISYGFMAKKVNIRALLVVGVGLNAAGTLFYLNYVNSGWAMFIEFQQGVTGGIAGVALIDLAMRATPAGCEGLCYSLILSAVNLAVNGSDYLSSWLKDFGWPLSKLVLVNAAATALALILVPFIPAVLMRSKDRQAPA